MARTRTWTAPAADIERERNVQVARVGNNLTQLARWANPHTSAVEAVAVIANLVAFERSLRTIARLARALAVLREARELADGSGLGFPSAKGRPLPEVAMPTMVRKLGIGAVPHGFRSSFRDWAAECSDAPREVCELALAHVNTNAMAAVPADRPVHLFERRRALMEHGRRS
jgi:integrase